MVNFEPKDPLSSSSFSYHLIRGEARLPGLEKDRKKRRGMEQQQKKLFLSSKIFQQEKEEGKGSLGATFLLPTLSLGIKKGNLFFLPSKFSGEKEGKSSQ